MASMKAKQLTQANVIVPAGVHLLDLQIPNDSVIWHLETDQFNHPKSSKRTICSTRTLTGLQCLLTFSQTAEISLYGPGRGVQGWDKGIILEKSTLSDSWLLVVNTQGTPATRPLPWGSLGCLQFITYPVVHGVHRYPWSVGLGLCPQKLTRQPGNLCISRPGKEHAACEARRKGPRNSPWALVPSWPFLEKTRWCMVVFWEASACHQHALQHNLSGS